MVAPTSDCGGVFHNPIKSRIIFSETLDFIARVCYTESTIN
nr:MAG TPA: hypothetical protein [Caudoviricetes sp.]